MTQSEKKRTLFSGTRNSKKKWVIIGLAVAVITGGGVFGYQTLLTPERAQAAYRIVTVKRGDVSETVLASGTVQASKRSSLSFSDAEDAKDAISTIQVKIGDRVKAGQVLATMDDSVAKIQVNNAQANLLSAQAKLEEAQKRKSAAEISSLQAAVTQAKNELELAKQNIDGQKATNDLAKAKDNLDNAQKTFDSQKVLFEAGAISQTEYDNARNALEQAKRDYNSAVLTAGQANSQSGVKVEQALASYQTAQEALNEALEGPDAATILAAKAAVEQAKAELQKAQKALNAVTLRAPMDGVIVQVNGNVGEIPGNDFIIMDNSDSGELEVLAQISQSDIGKVKEGLPVSFTTSSYPDDTFTGKVKLIYPEAKTDSGVTSYDVLLSVTNKDSKLKIGMTMNVTIELGTHKDVLYLPAAALQTQNGKDGVYLMSAGENSAKAAGNASGQSEARSEAQAKPQGNQAGERTTAREGRMASMPYQFVPIKIGFFAADRVEVVEGLKEGDRVVIPISISTSSSTANQNGVRMGGGMTGGMPGFGVFPGGGGGQMRGR
ncbi:efflux RND transporter periplasmic adaptor subunit [Brevibacillus gelatini]|uniref:Efflux RND transporter periplasmic adaptor subunit n=1 Tax=Brevibacillus gelatini TaxID=1655277 RepID=A0A3M8B1Z9_9BACL|nr:efflux RND transporter periplasmic adaptor subunit [Brevibacillus gelatini]RNB56905.1 efflux RND transporter periplasmic adaptor subunit [Brevibacillus gelatini]